MQQIAKIFPRGRLPRIAATMMIAGIGLTGIGQKADTKATLQQPVVPQPSAAKQRHIFPRLQIGKASWYGRAFQGKKTANGETFNMNMLTAAHRTLPLGSWVRVTNLKNRKSVLVRINDRGPVITSRVLDLSYAAARMLGLGGVGRVSLQQVRQDDPQTINEMLAEMPPLQPFPYYALSN